MSSDQRSPRSLDAVHIRPAHPRDAAELAALINIAFAVEKPFLEGERIDEQGTRDLLEKGKFLIAEDSTGMAGCVYCEMRTDRGYLGLLAVMPSRQGTGLGRKLMTAGEDYFREAGCKGVDLRVISQRGSLPPFYRHLGYVETGSAPFAPSLPAKVPGHYILMTKQLM